jgi:hypothetical protein
VERERQDQGEYDDDGCGAGAGWAEEVGEKLGARDLDIVIFETRGQLAKPIFDALLPK